MNLFIDPIKWEELINSPTPVYSGVELLNKDRYDQISKRGKEGFWKNKVRENSGLFTDLMKEEWKKMFKFLSSKGDTITLDLYPDTVKVGKQEYSAFLMAGNPMVATCLVDKRELSMDLIVLDEKGFHETTMTNIISQDENFTLREFHEWLLEPVVLERFQVIRKQEKTEAFDFITYTGEGDYIIAPFNVNVEMLTNFMPDFCIEPLQYNGDDNV